MRVELVVVLVVGAGEADRAVDIEAGVAGGVPWLVVGVEVQSD